MLMSEVNFKMFVTVGELLALTAPTQMLKIRESSSFSLESTACRRPGFYLQGPKMSVVLKVNNKYSTKKFAIIKTFKIER